MRGTGADIYGFAGYTVSNSYEIQPYRHYHTFTLSKKKKVFEIEFYDGRVHCCVFFLAPPLRLYAKIITTTVF